jgi:hypothetical protein
LSDGEPGPGRHDWVFDVLRDLLAYAQQNDLPALAARVEATIAVAEVEIDAEREQTAAAGQARVRSGSGRPN